MAGLGSLMAAEKAAHYLKLGKVFGVIAVLLVVGIYIASIKGDLRQARKVISNRDATIAVQQRWEGAIVQATRNAVGDQRIERDYAATYINALGTNLRAVTKALDDQSASIRTSAGKAQAAKIAVDAALAATGAQKDRARLHDSLNAPARADGLSQADWSNL